MVCRMGGHIIYYLNLDASDESQLLRHGIGMIIFFLTSTLSC